MTEIASRQRITDEQVRTILLAPKDVTNAELAASMGCSATSVQKLRRRASKRAIRVARELGVISEKPLIVGWVGKVATIGSGVAR